MDINPYDWTPSEAGWIKKDQASFWLCNGNWVASLVENVYSLIVKHACLPVPALWTGPWE
jgi:hypothetical protein